MGIYFDKFNSYGNVIIENNVEIGSNCSIDKGVTSSTIIGEGSKMDNMVMIGHGVIIGKNCLLAAQVGIAGKTTLEDNVTLWGQVGVSKNLLLGNGCVVLAKSGVSKNLEAGKTYFGIPAEEAKGKWKEMAEIKALVKGKEK
jgi:UDP-3-O-[3-hydroxymyristoyl] glucosamine N-acyltransferase